jgi:hypothetical protein
MADLKSYQRAYYQRNKEKIKQRAREWAQANPEKRKAIAQKHQAKKPKSLRVKLDAETLAANRKKTNQLRYATLDAKVKTAEATKRWAHENPERYAEIRNLASIKFRLRKRGLTIEQFEKMLADQGYCCAACGAESSGYKRNGKQGAKRTLESGWPTTAQQGDFTWSVDHDHKTGKARGILCVTCNSALGMVDDDITVLERLIAYLKTHRI